MARGAEDIAVAGDAAVATGTSSKSSDPTPGAAPGLTAGAGNADAGFLVGFAGLVWGTWELRGGAASAVFWARAGSGSDCGSGRNRSGLGSRSARYWATSEPGGSSITSTRRLRARLGRRPIPGTARAQSGSVAAAAAIATAARSGPKDRGCGAAAKLPGTPD